LRLVEQAGSPFATLLFSGSLSAGSATIEVNSLSALETTDETPCGSAIPLGGWILAVPKAGVTEAPNGVYTSTDPAVSFSALAASVVTDSDGFDWLCAGGN
jgi:hypothetical protein